MKVALIFPRYRYPSGDVPLGLGYIASSMKKFAKTDPDVYDTTFDSNKDVLKEKLKDKDYDIVGFSLMTSMLKDALEIADYIKEISPQTKIVFAGPHPTVLPEETLKNHSVDAIVLGEGELVFPEVVKKGEFRGVKGIWYKENGRIIRQDACQPTDDLDILPFPDYAKFDMEQYMRNWYQLDIVSKNIRGTNIITSRGCPYNCTYCQPTLRTLFGRKIRKRSPENIVRELEFLKHRYKIKGILFVDDTLIFDKAWVRNICKQMIRKKLNIIWGANVRANLVDEDLLKIMKKAGLRKVNMGIESGSQRILDEIFEKGITIEQVKKGTEIFRKLGIKCQGFFMLGAPTETIEEINQTIRFAVSLPITEATFSITTPLPHTYLYEKTKDMIGRDVSEFDYYKEYVYNSGNLTQEKLTRLKRKAYLMFYLSPYRWKHTFSSFLQPNALLKTLNKLRRF